jgi:hypothetical protein
VWFLDYGLLSEIEAGHLDQERAIARAVRARDADGLMVALQGAGYLPAARADAVAPEFALALMRSATRWYAVPGEHRFSRDGDHARRRRSHDGASGGDQGPEGAQRDETARADARTQVNQFTVPPESVLIRRMHGIVAIVLTQLRAGADWGAIAAEYLHGEPPATELGRAEAAFDAGRR